MLEAELEAQLEQAEKQISDLANSKLRLDQELTSVKVRTMANDPFLIVVPLCRGLLC